MELEAGTRAHYEDAEYYASNYADRTDDIDFYVKLAAGRRSVLEYGVGSGRIALPVARAGTRVVGVDLSAPMLDDLRAQLAREPAGVRERVEIVRGDMRDVRLRERFDLVICPFNAALHLYERRDVERFLARVTEHLSPKGELVFDISLPMPTDLARDPARAYRTPPFVHPSAGRVKYAEHFDYDGPRQILFVTMVFTPMDGAPWQTPLAHRQFFPREMEALLHYNGFQVTSLTGDFAGGPLSNDSEVMVWRARVRRKKGRA